jgi:hypothetical protein
MQKKSRESQSVQNKTGQGHFGGDKFVRRESLRGMFDAR